MIRGSYSRHGWAVIDGLLSFRLRRKGRPRILPVQFVVDTGAMSSLVWPENYEPFSYADFSKYPIDFPGGIGGDLEVRQVPAFLRLRHYNGRYERVSLTIDVAKPDPNRQPLPALLGLDVLGSFSLRADPTANLVILDRPMGPTP